MTRVLFFGTHPKQFNGYSKVVYEISNLLCKKKDIELGIFGFQNYYQNGNHRKDIANEIVVYDAFANEEPKANGFGIANITKYVQEFKPDVCIVYNDVLVITQVLQKLHEIPAQERKFKIVAYIDQVYLNQKKEFIKILNEKVDYAWAFTPYWMKCIKDQGLTIPVEYIQHGFNPNIYYPIPKEIARAYYGIRNEDFIILNLNRNQPRKRWDICLKAFAEVVHRHPNDPIKMMIATENQGAWNLMEIFERELIKRNMTLEDGMKHIIMFENPQRVTDEETNILYNIADVGINTCDGEGFGLCNFEQAALGIPQIVPNLGGFLDFLNEGCAMLIEPKMAYYVDNTRDMVCGEALLCDYSDYADAIIDYFLNRSVMVQHGQDARRRILKHYSWQNIVDKIYGEIQKICFTPSVNEIASLNSDIEKIDINSLAFLNEEPITVTPVQSPTVPIVPIVPISTILPLTPIPENPVVSDIKKKKKETRKELSKKLELMLLQKKIEKLLKK